jgi:nicotinic acid mononucleotide adenylyltransferase
MKKIAVTFGRMNPSTTGHQKLADKLVSVAKQNNAVARIYLSHTQNNKKDPLNYADKFKYAKKAFGNIVTKSDARTLIEVAVELEKQGFTDLIVVVGSDRITEFERLLEKYNESDYTFDSIKVVSAGERDPDSDDVSGMSASKVRDFAMKGDYESFSSGMPSKLSDKDKKEIYEKIIAVLSTRKVRKNKSAIVSKLKEEFEEDEMDEERKPLTLQQRQKRARMLKRIAPKLARFREIRKKRMADQPRLQKRARKLAIKMLRKRVAGDRGANYAELSPADKISIDKLVMKKIGMVQKMAQRLLPKVRKAEMERVKKARETVKEERVAQDPDVKDREGTQPKKYFSGLKKDIKARRDAQFKAGAEKDSGDPSAYPDKHAGDAGAETKPSKHTLKYKRMFGENEQQQRAREAIKREKELDKIRFDRLMDRARSADTTLKNKQTEEVNLDELSYEGNIGAMEVAKFYKIADGDQKKNLKELIGQKKFREAWQLVQKVTKEKLQGKEFDEEFEITESAEAALRKKAAKSGVSYGILKKVYDRGMAAWRTGHRPGATQQQWAFARVNSYITKGKGTYHGADKDLREEGGAGEEGTDKLVKKYVKDTPFAKVVKEDKGSFKHHVFQPTFKHAMYHAKIHQDLDLDGDVDALEKMVPDEVTGTEKNQTLLQKKFKDKFAKEKRHTRVGVAFESTEPCCDDCDEQFDHIVEETEYEGRKVKLNDPFRTPGGPKKFSVYVKNEKGNVVKVNFGDPNMEIKRDDPARRASFRARHGCDNPGPKWKAKYWSCYQWRAGAKVEN